MSENTTTTDTTGTGLVPTPPRPPRPDLTKVKPYTITRNGVNKTLTAFAGTRKQWDGVVYQAPQMISNTEKSLLDDTAFLLDVDWYGRDNIMRMINVISRRMAQDYHKDAIAEVDNQVGFPEGTKAGEFVESKFVSAMEKFATSAIRLSELIELYEDAVKAFTSASTNLVNEVIAADGDVDKIQEIKSRIDKLSGTVNSYRLEIEERRNRNSKEEQTETVVPE